MTTKDLKRTIKEVWRAAHNATKAGELENFGKAYLALGKELHRRLRNGEE